MKRKAFTFRTVWFEAMRNLSDNTRLALMDAICRYASEGIEPTDLEPVAQAAFVLIRAEIDSAHSPRKKDKPDAGSPTTAVAGPPTSTPKPASAEPDEFDRAYDEVASRVRKNDKWRQWLNTHGDIRNLNIAISEFKKLIRKYGRTEEFTRERMSEIVFCQRLIAAIDVCHFLPKEAFRPPSSGNTKS